MNIRQVKSSDAREIAEIYNYYIQNTHHTFETEPLTGEEMWRRIDETRKDYPYLVAADDGEILGYAYASRFRMREAYEYSVETSIYVKNDAKQKKIGTQLYVKLFDELAETNNHVIVAGIALPNDASISFHERLGFEKVAHFKEVGYKIGRWIDVGYWQMLNRI